MSNGAAPRGGYHLEAAVDEVKRLGLCAVIGFLLSFTRDCSIVTMLKPEDQQRGLVVGICYWLILTIYLLII
jgi:hypothetical protein